MEPTTSMQDQAFLKDLRRRRADLRESMNALEHALAAPAVGGRERWSERVRAALVELSGDFRGHVEMTEGEQGLYQEVLSTAPRLTEAVHRLTHEHHDIKARLDELVELSAAGDADVDRLRGVGTELLGTLVRHRQRGSDLVYEAYEFDMGGET